MERFKEYPQLYQSLQIGDNPYRDSFELTAADHERVADIVEELQKFTVSRSTEGEEKPFICHSWLLYPKHEEILNHNSNTYKFFSRFDVFEWADNEGDDLWRLFDTEDRNPDRLPANTSFRRNYVEHLKRGGLVGWGLGVFFF